MSATITSDAGSTSPTLVLGYETTLAAQTIVHDLIGGGIGITLIRPRPRSGTLELFYLTEDDAKYSADLHTDELVYTLTTDDLDSIEMTYVVAGAGIGLRLDSVTRRRWIVTVSYQEVTP